MKRPWWLFALGAVATFLSFPFPPPLLQLIAAEVIVALLVWAGLWFGGRVDLGSRPVSPLRAAYTLLIGVVSGAIVLAMLPLAGLQSRILKEASIPLWKWLVISFNAAVLEEIVFRLFLVSFVVWLVTRFARRETAIPVAVVVSALAFGAVHLGRWLQAGPTVITAVMLVNGFAAIVLCVVYIKWGIEAAMLSHFAADIVVHVAGPHFFS